MIGEMVAMEKAKKNAKWFQCKKRMRSFKVEEDFLNYCPNCGLQMHTIIDKNTRYGFPGWTTEPLKRMVSANIVALSMTHINPKMELITNRAKYSFLMSFIYAIITIRTSSKEKQRACSNDKRLNIYAHVFSSQTSLEGMTKGMTFVIPFVWCTRQNSNLECRFRRPA